MFTRIVSFASTRCVLRFVYTRSSSKSHPENLLLSIRLPILERRDYPYFAPYDLLNYMCVLHISMDCGFFKSIDDARCCRRQSEPQHFKCQESTNQSKCSPQRIYTPWSLICDRCSSISQLLIYIQNLYSGRMLVLIIRHGSDVC